MDLSAVKLVVSDMDGTLLNTKHEVSDLFFELFEKMKHKNIKFVAASGRQYHSILKKLKKIEQDITIVAENGAYVVKGGKELFVNAFSRTQVQHLISIIHKIPDTQMVLAGKKKAYFLKTKKELEELIAEYYCEYQILDNFDVLPEDEILKIAIYHPSNSEKYTYPYVKHLAKDFQVKISGEFWLDIALPNNHKGNAIKEIQKQMKVTLSETMAFGDYHNDIELLQEAKYSFAMGNAHQDIKEIATYETLTNDEFGVEEVLKKIV